LTDAEANRMGKAIPPRKLVRFFARWSTRSCAGSSGRP
jgi:hypothetical protein